MPALQDLIHTDEWEQEDLSARIEQTSAIAPAVNMVYVICFNCLNCLFYYDSRLAVVSLFVCFQYTFYFVDCLD